MNCPLSAAQGIGWEYADFNGLHFYEKLQAQHGIQLSYTWVKTALQTAGLVAFGKRRFQIPKAAWRYSFAKCRVKVYEHLDGTLSIGHGPHTLGYYDTDGCLLTPPADTAGGTGMHARRERTTREHALSGEGGGPSH